MGLVTSRVVLKNPLLPDLAPVDVEVLADSGASASPALKVRSLTGKLLLLIFFPVSVHALGVGDSAPDWTLQSPAGQQIAFHADSRHQVSVVLFWATWCPFCRKLMPHIQAVADEFRDKPVRFYAIDVWEDADPVAHFREHGYTFTLLLSGERVAKAWGVKGTPGLFVVDRSRTIIYQRVSGDDDLDVEIALRETISAALGD